MNWSLICQRVFYAAWTSAQLSSGSLYSSCSLIRSILNQNDHSKRSKLSFWQPIHSPHPSAQRSASSPLSSSADKLGAETDSPPERPHVRLLSWDETQEWVTWPSRSSWHLKFKANSVLWCRGMSVPPGPTHRYITLLHCSHSADVLAWGLQCVSRKITSAAAEQTTNSEEIKGQTSTQTGLRPSVVWFLNNQNLQINTTLPGHPGDKTLTM